MKIFLSCGSLPQFRQPGSGSVPNRHNIHRENLAGLCHFRNGPVVSPESPTQEVPDGRIASAITLTTSHENQPFGPPGQLGWSLAPKAIHLHTLCRPFTGNHGRGRTMPVPADRHLLGVLWIPGVCRERASGEPFVELQSREQYHRLPGPLWDDLRRLSKYHQRRNQSIGICF